MLYSTEVGQKREDAAELVDVVYRQRHCLFMPVENLFGCVSRLRPAPQIAVGVQKTVPCGKSVPGDKQVRCQRGQAMDNIGYHGQSGFGQRS
jgi:hypothetical protein